MSDNNETMFALMAKLGEIASDVKHIMSNQQAHDKRADDLEIRMRAVEKFHWKTVGIATILPIALTIGGYAIKVFAG